MSIALADSKQYGYHRFTVKDFYALAKSGAFPDESRMELIDGLFFDMQPPGPFHCSIASQLVELIRKELAEDLLLREEKPVSINEYTLPIPDISIVKQRSDDPFFATSHPNASELALVIEIADSSYLRDRNVKLEAYAQAGIPEYWIVNVKKRHIEWFRSPRPETSDFAESGIFKAKEVIARDLFSLDLAEITF